MNCKRGDIVLIRFPFTTLSKYKKRPVLILENENEYRDFICFQITSKNSQSNIVLIDENALNNGYLPLVSFVKYDKCFTLNSKLVEKKLATVSEEFLLKLKKLFCDRL